METALHGEYCNDPSLSALNCMPELCVSTIRARTYKGVPGILFQPVGLTEACPIQSRLRGYSLSNIFTYQSEQLYSEQSGKRLLDQQVARTGSPHLHEDRPIRDQGHGLLYVKVSSSLALREHFPLPQRTEGCVSQGVSPE